MSSVALALLFLTADPASQPATEGSLDDAALDAAFGEGSVMGVIEEEKQLFQTASLTATTLDETPAILTVLTRADIRRMGLRTLAEALPLVPGVSVALNQLGERRVNVRGRNSLSSEGVKILIDGHAMNEPSTSGATRVFDTYPLMHVERIEVIRGPGSAIYGANAFTGVINIVTRKSAYMSYEVFGQADSLLTFGGGVQAQQQLGPVHLSAFLAATTTQGSRQIITQDRLSGTQDAAQGLTPAPADTRERRIDGQLRVDYKYVTVNGGFSGKAKGDFAGIDFVLTGAQNATPPSELRYGHTFADITLTTGTLWERVTPELKLHFDHFTQNEDVRLTPAPFRLSRDLDGDGADELWPDGRRRRRNASSMNIGGELSVSVVLFKGNTLSAGYVHELQRQINAVQDANFDIDTGAAVAFARQLPYTEPQYDREIVAGYLEDYWKIFDIAAITAGLRIDHYRDFGFAFSPRAAFVIQPVEGFYLKALYGRAFRAPSFLELFSRREPSVIGNPTLRPEILNTVEGQASFRRKNPFRETRETPIVDKLLAQAAYYWTQIDDPIVVGDQIGGTGPRRLTNLGRVQLHGAEIDLQLSFLQMAQLRANASFRSATNAQTKQRLSEVSDVLFNVEASSRLYWQWLYASVGLVFESERSRAIGDNPLRASGQPTNPERLQRIPAVLDLRAAITVRDLKIGPLQLDVALIGRNLTNQRQFDPSPLYTGPGSATTPTDYPRPGIYVGGLVTLRFEREKPVKE